MTPTLPATGTRPLDRFRVFYTGVSDLRNRVHDGAWRPPDSDRALRAAQGPLLGLLEELAASASTGLAGDPAERHERYLMAAFADDLFTRLDWPLREAWSASTLESQIFQTDRAAGVVFDRIDQLLEVGDPGRRGLARLYLMALALGFRGRYSGDADGSLDRYREALLAFAVPRDGQPEDELTKLSPDAYRHTLGSFPGRLLPNLRRWALITAAVVVLVGVLSIPLWRDATRSIATAIETVLNP